MQMTDGLIAQHYFCGTLVHRGVKLSFSKKFFSDRWLPYILIKMLSTHSWCESEHFNVAWLPSYHFALFSCALVLFIFHCFILSVGFSNEDNCCQSEGIGKSIKKVLWELINLLTSLQIWPAFLCEWIFKCFFPKSCLKVGAWLIHECGLYTIVYGSWILNFLCLVMLIIHNQWISRVKRQRNLILTCNIYTDLW